MHDVQVFKRGRLSLSRLLWLRDQKINSVERLRYQLDSACRLHKAKRCYFNCRQTDLWESVVTIDLRGWRRCMLARSRQGWSVLISPVQLCQAYTSPAYILLQRQQQQRSVVQWNINRNESQENEADGKGRTATLTLYLDLPSVKFFFLICFKCALNQEFRVLCLLGVNLSRHINFAKHRIELFRETLILKFHGFLADRTAACNRIGYWHDTVFCLSLTDLPDH